MQKYLRRLTSLTLALLMVFSLVSYQKVSAGAEVTDCFDVTPSFGWSSTGNVITIDTGGTYTITQNCGHVSLEHLGYQIVISGSITVELTIKDVHISNSSGAAMDIDGSAKVTLAFVGDNSFASANYHAGIQFNDATGSLTITSDSEDNTLTAKGGYAAAGIGGGDYGSTSNITISGGTVYAYGGDYAAGIGGGYDGSGFNITISGGTVTATGGTNAAGIGGGQLDDGSNITISGGTVTATGGNGGAGIGGGNVGDGFNITISGGTVTAVSDNGAGIGSGSVPYITSYNITISGGTVKASSISVTPQNESNDDVYLYTIADVENVQSVTVDGIDFNISSNHSDDNNLYLYLTDGEHEIEVIAGNKIYEAVCNGQSCELQYVKDVETSTAGTTGSPSSGITIVDTSTR